MEKQDPISGVIEKTASLDEKKFRNMITSPQQTPRFTDSYAAALYHTPECYESSPSPHPVTNLEDADSMPTSDSEPSDIHGSQSVDPEDEVDDDDACEDLYRNPDPPKELVEQHLVDADNIGNTVFSKHWVFTTLMNLLKSVEYSDQEPDKEENAEVFGGDVEPVELEDGLQDDLCKLWDMSMNQEVVNFLVEYNSVDLLVGVIAKSRAPRATEICVGIIGNMACSPDVCHLLGSKKELVDLIFLLLDSPDAPTLVETMRFLHVCVSSKKSELWIAAIKNATVVYDRLLFILQSSTNRDLLKYTAEFIDKMMEAEEDICTKWSNPELVLAVMEAIKQTGSHVSQILETFLHVLQLISTSEQGVQALASYCGQVCVLILGYLKHICRDDIVGVERHENVIGSALSILGVIFGLWDEHMNLLQTDFQLFRCTLKILDVVYQKHLRLPPGLRKSRDQSGSGVSELNEESAYRETDDHVLYDQCTPAVGNSFNLSVYVEKECETAQLSINDGTEKQNENQPNMKNNDGNSKEKSDLLELTNESRDVTLAEISEYPKVQTPSSDYVHRDEEYAIEMTNILFEVLQNLLSELVVMLAELPVSEKKQVNGSEKVLKESEADKTSDSAYLEETPIPMSLVYMDKLCDRCRIQYMVKTLGEVKDRDCNALLFTVSQRHGLKRLAKIIESTTERTFL